MNPDWKFVKVIDTIHPDLELPEICYSIMDTPEFQRLRYIKQIGSCSRIFPTANHTRFEHSIGVSHLAGKYGKILQKKEPRLNIDDRDVLCLYIAGLTHDLGHGPFSHAWQNFIKSNGDLSYSHNNMAVKMLDHLLNVNFLLPVLEQHGLSLPTDLTFIKELILGKPQTGEEFEGRTRDKWFLYQIITNRETKVDVDRFDYVLRDCKQLNIETNFDAEVIMTNTRVKRDAKDDGRSCLAYSREVLDTLKELFVSRADLQRVASQRRVNKVIERMLVDAFSAANSEFRVKGTNREYECNLFDSSKDPAAFAKLTDTILDHIYNWEKGGKVARRIISDLLRRRLYWTLGELNNKLSNQDEISKLLEAFSCLALIETKVDYSADPVTGHPLNSAFFYGGTHHHTKNHEEQDHFFRQNFPLPKEDIKHYLILRPMYVIHKTDPENDVSAEQCQVEMEDMKERVLRYIAQNGKIDIKLRDLVVN